MFVRINLIKDKGIDVNICKNNKCHEFLKQSLT